MLLKSVLRPSLLAIFVVQVVATNNLYPRQSNSAADTPDPPTTSPPTPPPQPSQPVQPSNPPPTPSSSSTTPAPDPPSSEPPASTPTSTNTPPPNDPDPPTTPPPSTDPTLDPGPVIVNPDDVIQTSIKTRSSNPSSATLASSTPTETDNKDNDDGIGTGAIVGMSVAGGLAVLGIVAFFIWKFTRKRFSSFDESEPIRWPELNSHGGTADSHPLPVRDTGRSGFGDTGSESDLSRINQGNYSTTDFNGAHDPYAVPPLPHLNPNQPYRDDPAGAAGYYDPYRGPVPGTVENGQSWEGEAIPMNQLGHGGAPGGYEQQQLYGGGRASPGPLQAYDTGRGSPAPPNMGYQQPAVYDQGRQSPGPMAAYGRASPGPNAALGTAGYSQQPPGYR